MNDYYKTCKFAKPTMAKKKRKTVSKETYRLVYETCQKCVLCGKQNNLELHHVLGRGEGLTDNYRYCVMLCKHCHHAIVHQNLKKYRPILIEICEELYGNLERY